MILLAILALICASSAGNEGPDNPASPTFRAAAERCSLKLKSLQDFAANHGAGQEQVTRFSEDEVNSYLALNMSHKYHPSLKSLEVTFKKNGLQGIALIDFDLIGSPSDGASAKIFSALFPGKHNLAARGEIISHKGKAYFRLEQALLDGRELPKFLIEQVITAVGRRQSPPLDPLRPSQLPYEIQSVQFHRGFMMVYQ